MDNDKEATTKVVKRGRPKKTEVSKDPFLQQMDTHYAKSKKPWAIFQTNGISPEGRIKFVLSFNKAFINNIRKHGIEGATDEEAAMMFLVASQMLPEEMMREESQPIVQLESDDHNFVRG